MGCRRGFLVSHQRIPFLLLAWSHQIRKNAPYGPHGLNPVILLEEVVPSRSFKLWRRPSSICWLGGRKDAGGHVVQVGVVNAKLEDGDVVVYRGNEKRLDEP